MSKSIAGCPFCGSYCCVESEVFWPEAESLDMYRVGCESLTCEYQSGFKTDESEAVSSHNGLAEQAARIAELEAGIVEISDRFKDKLSLHKEDCFAYQVCKRLIGGAREGAIK